MHTFKQKKRCKTSGTIAQKLFLKHLKYQFFKDARIIQNIMSKF